MIEIDPFTPLSVGPFNYIDVRARMLEGTWPNNLEDGVWPFSALRTEFGRGNPPLRAIALLNNPRLRGGQKTDSQADPFPRCANQVAKLFRSSGYFRLDGVKDIIEPLRFKWPISADIRLATDWANYTDGILSKSSTRTYTPRVHAISLIGLDQSGNIEFDNSSWGEGWGSGGRGVIEPERLEADLVIATMMFPACPEVVTELPAFESWQFPVHGRRTLTVNCITDVGFDERVGWVIALEDSDSIAVQDIFVHPQFRRIGLGTKLAKSVSDHARVSGKSVRYVIPYPDAIGESKEGTVRFFSSLGIGVSWSTPILGAAGVAGADIDIDLRSSPDIKSFPAKPSESLSTFRKLASPSAVLEPPAPMGSKDKSTGPFADVRGRLRRIDDPFGPTVPVSDWEASGSNGES